MQQQQQSRPTIKKEKVGPTVELFRGWILVLSRYGRSLFVGLGNPKLWIVLLLLRFSAFCTTYLSIFRELDPPVLSLTILDVLRLQQ
jgi:hypothetical protein